MSEGVGLGAAAQAEEAWVVVERAAQLVAGVARSAHLMESEEAPPEVGATAVVATATASQEVAGREKVLQVATREGVGLEAVAQVEVAWEVVERAVQLAVGEARSANQMEPRAAPEAAEATAVGVRAAAFRVLAWRGKVVQVGAAKEVAEEVMEDGVGAVVAVAARAGGCLVQQGAGRVEEATEVGERVEVGTV